MRTPITLYLLALGVRLLLIALFPDPAYPDSSYYVNVARNVAGGQGFQVDFIWIFAEVGGTIPADPVLPIPSNAHWMPLASIVQVPFIWLLGPTAVASALPFAILGSLAAPLTWAIARDAGASSLVAVGAGILICVPGLMTVFMGQPDNFGLYQPLVAGALWMAARGLRGHPRSFVLGGLLVGVATLSRNDGVLVGAVLGLAFFYDRWRAWRSGGTRVPAIPLWAAVGCFGLFLVVMAPWWIRQLVVFGQLSPSTASGKVLFIRSIEEWNSITTPANLRHLLDQGIGPFVQSRVGGFIAALDIYNTLVAARFLLPFVLIGAWARRRSPDFGPFFAYVAILFSFSALVSAVHVPGGTFIHSAVALAPHTYILALEGIAVLVAWIAARRPRWNRGTATALFSGAIVGIVVLAAIPGAIATIGIWDGHRVTSRAVTAALDLAGASADARVMSIDAAGTRYWTGRGGVVSPNDPLETIQEVTEAYQIEWLVIDPGDSVAAFGPVVDGARPPWIGPPIATIPGPGGTTASIVYPVCVSPEDRRCSTVALAAPDGPS
ncbi:MAG TPA: glycosyltransferase family 39 protein [Candidatus Limnocylindrales bacterium]|nr:glycosyltransferase family 39 protein [Candidatus Limnocylindrales bacterium]